MPEISKITLPNGNTYDIKDTVARASMSGAIVLKGVTTTALADEATTNPIVIDGSSYTAKANDAVFYNKKEFVFDGTKWHEFGDMSGLGALATKDSASTSYTPAGTVSQPTFKGTASTVTVTASTSTSGNYTPAGTVSQPTFTGESTTFTGSFTPAGSVSVTTKSTSNKTATVSPASSGTATYTPGGNVSGTAVELNTTTVNSITAVGTLPSLTTTVADETLTIGWSAGTLPTKGSNTTVATSVKTVTDPTFSGTGVRLVTGNIAVPSAYTAEWTGSEGTVSVTGTPEGSVSQPTFSGTKVSISGTVTPSGTVSKPTFSGTTATITVS